MSDCVLLDIFSLTIEEEKYMTGETFMRHHKKLEIQLLPKTVLSKLVRLDSLII